MASDDESGRGAADPPVPASRRDPRSSCDVRARPRDPAPRVEPGRDDNVYLPGLTEPAGAPRAADMRQYKGEGGPLDDSGYPPCSATVKDRCIELDNPAG